MRHLLFQDLSTETLRLMRDNGLVVDKIYFEADAVPDQEPVEFPVKVFSAGVLWRADDYAYKSVSNSLQFEKMFFVYSM